MRIGLVRHFPVAEPLPSGWKTAADLARWREVYDASPTVAQGVDLGGVHFDHCLSSDLARAAATARAIYPGLVEQSPLLREPDFAPFPTGTMRLPVVAWRYLLQLSWLTGHSSQRMCRDAFLGRVAAAATLLERSTGDTLVVSHAGMMAFLSAELRRRGFLGPKLRIAKHATLYLYERR